MKNFITILAIFILTPLLSFAQTARVQVIHNSADAAASSVDIYINGTNAVPGLNYMQATPFVDLDADVELSIDIVPAGMDISNSVYNLTATLAADETYILVADGIVSGSGYSPAPAFNVEIYSGAREMASNMMNTDVLVHHGSTDAPTVDVYEQSGLLLSDDLMYTDFAGYLELPTADYYLQIRDETGETTLLAYDAPLGTLELDGAAITVIASGFLNPANNSEGQSFGLYAVTAAGGEFLPLETSTARVQVIHNSADAIASTVDVYLNDEILLPDFAYMTATPFVSVPAGVTLDIDIAPGNSMSASESIFNLTAPLMADETYILVADGIVSGSGYDPAPAFNVEIYSGAREMASDMMNTDVLVHHGSTDAPTVDVYEQSGLLLSDDLMYTDFAGYLELPTADYYLQIRDETGETTLLAYDAPLGTLELDGAAITVIASGFLNPANNSDGQSLGLYAVTAAGGEFLPLETSTARVQVIHNSADAIASTVDVYLNDEILLPDFAYMTATPFVSVPAGVTLDIDIASGNSMSASESIFNLTAPLMADETYILVADGIVSGSGYDPAPAFNVEIYSGAREIASDMMNTDVLVHHGSTDAPTVDVYEQSGLLLSDDLMYTDFAGYLELPTADYYLQIRDETGETTLLAYDAPLGTLELDGAAITVIASGFLNPANNSDGQSFGLYAVTAAGGEFLPLETSKAMVQVVHNSADALASMVDVYLFDEILLPDFAFRTATPFVEVPAGINLDIDIAPGNSMSASESIYNLTAPLMAGESYMLVANGIVDAANYDPAPAFDIDIFKGARTTAMMESHTDLLIHHGATDAPTVDIYEASDLELVNDLMYRHFSEDYIQLPTADYDVEIRLENGMDVVKSYAADLSTFGLENSAIMVMASGFLNPAVNNNGAEFGLFAVLGDGTVVALEENVLSSNENIILDENLNIYPNPASESLQVGLIMETTGDLEIQIFNLNGQSVLNTSFYNLTKGQSNINLPIAELDNGMYTVHFISEENAVVKKLQVLR